MVLQSFENKKWRSYYLLTTTGLRDWTGGPLVEPHILLQIFNIVQNFPVVIYLMLMILRPCLIIIL